MSGTVPIPLDLWARLRRLDRPGLCIGIYRKAPAARWLVSIGSMEVGSVEHADAELPVAAAKAIDAAEARGWGAAARPPTRVPISPALWEAVGSLTPEVCSVRMFRGPSTSIVRRFETGPPARDWAVAIDDSRLPPQRRVGADRPTLTEALSEAVLQAWAAGIGQSVQGQPSAICSAQ